MGGIAAQIDFVLQQGTTFSLTFTWNDDTGAHVNLTGYTAQAMLREESKNGDLVFTFKTTPTGSDGTITLGGVAGTVAFSASPTLTSDIPEGRYAYDLELTSGAGVVTRIAEGFVTVTREATR